ncbi:MAG: hypothetical protein A2X00_12535 [Bacteroidetes bacterium GWE2_32_14]|nr:MAG: hypothetical protein A2X00_12535 [Bacteroidetes bacterium GWE2_32_14]
MDKKQQKHNLQTFFTETNPFRLPGLMLYPVDKFLDQKFNKITNHNTDGWGNKLVTVFACPLTTLS